MANRRVTPDRLSLHDLRIGWVDHFFTDNLDQGTSTAIARSLSALSRAGGRIDDIRLAPLTDISTLQEFGGITAIESYTTHRDWIREKAHLYDPRVLSRIQRGEKALAWQYLELLERRRVWISAMKQTMLNYDILLSPTVAITSPPLAQFEPHPDADEHFIKTNALILRNTSTVNLLDGCAISIPCHQPDEMPVGLMVWSFACNDDRILASARLIEQALRAVK
jgi:Asp-tRNA(Asn)/Glu-tRNA(Gln) amidotransferase A subunit family amidase